MGKGITLRETVVFDGYRGWEHGGLTYRLAVGGALSQAPNGDILCTWLSGTDSEPATDNCLLCAKSSDGGKTWSEPWVIMPSGREAGSGLIWSLPGPGQRMIFLAARWPVASEYCIWHYEFRESMDYGHTWSAARPVTFREGDTVSVGRPIRLSDGRLLIVGSTFDLRETPLRGDVTALAHARDEAEAQAISARCDAPPSTDKFYRYLHGVCILETDEANTRFTPLATINNRPLGLLEPSLIELTDGRLVLMIRAEYGGYLWRSDSEDGGRTWCPAYPTDIRNPTTLANLVRLPDGRIAMIHNDCGGVVGQRAKRDPLSIWVSNDEMETWYIKADVLSGGNFAYPCPLITQDGRFVFGYDMNRRQVRFVEVLID